MRLKNPELRLIWLASDMADHLGLKSSVIHDFTPAVPRPLLADIRRNHIEKFEEFLSRQNHYALVDIINLALPGSEYRAYRRTDMIAFNGLNNFSWRGDARGTILGLAGMVVVAAMFDIFAAEEGLRSRRSKPLDVIDSIFMNDDFTLERWVIKYRLPKNFFGKRLSSAA